MLGSCLVAASLSSVVALSSHRYGDSSTGSNLNWNLNENGENSSLSTRSMLM